MRISDWSSDVCSSDLRNYFGQVAPPPLETAEGAGLAPETVEALAGPAIPPWFAQAGDSPFGAPVGEISFLNGIARVQRADGTRSDLDEGDPIFQGDVVSTGVGSDLGILFADNTVFSLSANARVRSEEHTSELQSLMRISYAGFCLKKKK